MRVVLSGYYGFDNCGDEAILFSIIYALRKIQPNIEITVLSNNPEKTRKTYEVNSISRKNILAVSKAIKDSDGLISGGGSLLQDATGPLSIPYYTGIIQLAKLYRKPVFIYAQGMGPINRTLSKWIVKVTLNKVDTITVRDENSKDLLQVLGIKHNAKIAPDPVLGIDSSSFKSSWLEAQQVDKPIITVSVRNWKNYRLYKHKIASCLDSLIRNGYTIIFVPMHNEHDYEASLEVASLMNEESLLSPHNASIMEKIAIIGQSRLLIGMRLHSLIFSALSATPFVAISYDPKIDSFAEISNQPVIGDVMVDTWGDQDLFKKAEQILENEATYKENLEKKINNYKKEAILTAIGAVQTISPSHSISYKGVI